MRVVDCCNGIFCLYESYDKTLLWNPATGEVKALPESNITKGKGLQSHTFMHVGIGFDPNTNDIKVIRNVGSKFGDKFEIYTLSTDSWRQLHDVPETLSMRHCKYPLMSTCINGRCHWLAGGMQRMMKTDSIVSSKQYHCQIVMTIFIIGMELLVS